MLWLWACCPHIRRQPKWHLHYPLHLELVEQTLSLAQICEYILNTQLEEKTRNGNLRTLSGDGELAGARAKQPELIWPKRVLGPVIVPGEIDVLPAEWREMHQVVRRLCSGAKQRGQTMALDLFRLVGRSV